MRTRGSLRIAGIAALAAMLFAQAALALAACDWGARDAARAVMVAAGSGDAPCHEAGKASPDSGLCLTHCLGERQSLDKPSAALPALATAAVLTLHRLAPESRHALRTADQPATAAGPPLRILFQSFQI